MALGLIAAVVAMVASNGHKADASQTGLITVYSAGTIPSVAAENDPKSVELGVRFAASQPGNIVGIRYFKSAQNGATHVGTLWSASGAKLASATFTSESSTGWQEVRFAAPVAISANTSYVASYHTTTGYYAQQQGAFSNGATLGVNPALKASSGVYAYGSGAFPQATWHNSAYYVDVLFQPNGAASTATPSLSTSATPTPTVTKPGHKPTKSGTTSASTGATGSTSTTKPANPPSTSSSTPKPPSQTPPSQAPPANSGGLTAHPLAGVPAGTALTAYTGPTTITKDGTVIDAKTITQSLEISAKNVVISRSVFHSGDGEAIHVSGSATITDTTVSGGENGIGGDNYTATRVEVTNLSDDGFKLGNNVHVDQSWCHDMTPTTQAHADCGQMQAGVTNMSVTNSWFDGGRNSALFLAPDLGPSSNGPVLINNNVLGNGNYSLYCVDGNNGEYIVKNITITNNKFLRTAQYGPATVNVPVTASNNTWFDTGKSIGSPLN
ncbi:DUF4082 domain-containing protein [Jatrophihabitans sp. DSM 45814]